MVGNKDLPTIFSFFTSIFFLDRHHFFVYHIYFHIYTSIFIRHSRQIPQISPSTSDCRVKKVINMCSVGLFGSIFFIIFYIIFLFFQSLLVQKKTKLQFFYIILFIIKVHGILFIIYCENGWGPKLQVAHPFGCD